MLSFVKCFYVQHIISPTDLHRLNVDDKPTLQMSGFCCRSKLYICCNQKRKLQHQSSYTQYREEIIEQLCNHSSLKWFSGLYFCVGALADVSTQTIRVHYKTCHFFRHLRRTCGHCLPTKKRVPLKRACLEETESPAGVSQIHMNNRHLLLLCDTFTIFSYFFLSFTLRKFCFVYQLSFARCSKSICLF